MDLPNDLKEIREILILTVNEIGDFTRINFKGGNEQKILRFIMDVQQYLTQKRYIVDHQPNIEFNKELNEIIFFLAINTQYKKQSIESKQYSFVGLLPPLSKCVLSNLLFGLNLNHQFYNLIEKLPIGNAVELLDEANLNLRDLSIKNSLQWTSMILGAARDKLAVTEFCPTFEDDIDNVAEITNLMLLNLTGFYFQDAKTLKSMQIYQHMGFCLLNLFNILLECKKELSSLTKFMKNIMRVCIFIARSVTVDVFCAWAEVEEDDEVLQCTIAETAYKIIQHFHDFDDATELVTTLQFIARKPRTIAEKVRNATTVTMIKNINKADADQEKWFQALLANFQSNQNKDSLKCIKKWCKLSNEDDVVRLLNIYVKNHAEDIKETVLKSASMLTLDQLMTVCTRHFYSNKFSHTLTNDIELEVTSVINNMNENLDNTKGLIFLFLQNPEQVIQVLYRLCLRNSSYTESLKKFFECTKEISKIDNIGINVLHKEIHSYYDRFDRIYEGNVENHVKLFKCLWSAGFFNENIIWNKLFLNLMKDFKENRFQDLEYLLKVIMDTNIKFLLSEENRNVVEYFLNLIHESRTDFINFNRVKQNHLKYSIDIIMDLCIPNEEVSITSFQGDCFMNYYVKFLSGSKTLSFLEIICKEFDIRNYGKSVTMILKILPVCVTREWLIIAEELICNAGYVKCVEILSDGLLLLSELVQSQMLESAEETMAVALCHCLQNYSTVIMQKVLPNTTMEEEVEINKFLCRLLSKLPDLLKDQAGLQLVQLFSDRSLKDLASNKDFLCRLMLIKNSNICKTLAEKMRN